MSQPFNLLILCCDELRGDCVGYSGNRDVRTPALDRLASEGVAFGRHYSTFPKCTPSRVSLVTGRYTHTDAHRALSDRLRTDEPDLFAALQSKGYDAAVFGKNHCWDDGRWSSFTRTPAGSMGDRAGSLEQSAPRGAPVRAKAIPRLPDGFQYAGPHDHCVTDPITERHAIGYLSQRRAGASRPFVMQVNFESPHPRYGVSEPWFSMFDRDRICGFPLDVPNRAPLCVTAQRTCRTGEAVDPAHCREVQAVYYGMIAQVDARIDRVLRALDKSGEADRTVVVLWSDHGDYAGQYGLVEKWDTHFAECLVHVPCIIRAPGWPRGKRIDDLSDHTDLAPTIARLLGIELPWTTHGHDLSPSLQGEAVRSAVFSEGGHETAALERAPEHIRAWVDPAKLRGETFPKNETYIRFPQSMARARMVRTKSHKLVIRTTGDHELYVLDDDPWEMDNRYGSPDLLNAQSELLQKLAVWCLETDPDRPALESIGA